jgi:RNase P/RNase MRP subunit p30
MNFCQLKRQLQRQRQSFLRFERRLHEKYERPLHQIVSNPIQKHHCRRIRSMPSESID